MTQDPFSALEMDREVQAWRPTGGALRAQRDTEDEGAIVSLLRLLRRNVWVIGVTAVLVAVVAYLLSLLLPERYASTASLLFQQSPLVGQITGYNPGNPFGTVAEEGATNVALVGARPIAAGTARQLGGGYDTKKVIDDMDFAARPDTGVVDVTGTAGSAGGAARLTNTYVHVFLDSRRAEVQREIEQALAGLDRQLKRLTPDARRGSAGRELGQRIDTLRTLAAVQSPNVDLIQPAQTPIAPVSPRPTRNAVLGLLFGLLLGVGLGAVRQQMDPRVRDEDELESLATRPLIGVIPRHRALARATQPVDLPSAVLDAFRLLEVSLRYRGGGAERPCVMVTSSAAGEGKTVCSWHLAVTMATAGKRTLFIEADLRRGSVAERWGLARGPGLADVLLGRLTRAEAVQQVPVRQHHGADALGVLELDVLLAGDSIMNPSELFDSPRVRELVRECGAEYDAVVIDTPPLSLVADAVPLVDIVTDVVIVAAPGVTQRRSFERLQEDVAQLHPRFYGAIANGVGAAVEYGSGYH